MSHFFTFILKSKKKSHLRTFKIKFWDIYFLELTSSRFVNGLGFSELKLMRVVWGGGGLLSFGFFESLVDRICK